MPQKIVAIIGTYRKGGITNQSVTALMKRFIERLIVYSYWPWDIKGWPKYRISQINKRAVTVTSSACPAFIARILIPSVPKLLKAAARTLGAKVVASIYFGLVANQPDQKLTEKQRQKAYLAGLKLVS
ncbi:MAG: hypothetical protein JW860_03070 [Sedimentisphaerales bacterium]|nr:hypothetical protein [Sedimentisphaerales bacterium]